MLAYLYEHVTVWKRHDDKLLQCFHCLRRLADGMYAVQNSNFHHAAGDVQTGAPVFLELFRDEDPSVRCDWHPSLADAVAAHETDFAGMPGLGK